MWQDCIFLSVFSPTFYAVPLSFRSGPINVGGTLCVPRQTSVPARSSKTVKWKQTNALPGNNVYVCVYLYLCAWMVNQVAGWGEELHQRDKHLSLVILIYLYWVMLVFCPTSLFFAANRAYYWAKWKPAGLWVLEIQLDSWDCWISELGLHRSTDTDWLQTNNAGDHKSHN